MLGNNALPGGRTPAKKVQQIGKKSILGFWHLPMKDFMLSSKITFFFGVGASGRRRKHLKIAKLYFFTLQASPLAALTCLTKIPGDPGRPVQSSGLVPNVQKCNFSICNCFLRLPGCPKPKTKVIFVISMKY